MAQEILINVSPLREVRVALLENQVVQEIHIERNLRQGLLGNIYKGRVSRLIPGIQAAFVDIGMDRAAFLHMSDVATPLKPGQDILVQVYKDALGTKGPRLTTQFTIPSRYLVFTPGAQQVSISQKITDEAERERLMSLITPHEQGGYIFRTVAEGAKADAIEADKLLLDKIWAEIQARALLAKPGSKVFEEIPIVLRVLRDFADDNVEKIRVDDENTFKKMREFAQQYMPTLVERIELYTGKLPIFECYSVEEELQKALERRVPLKSGGDVIIDQTEAMTTIDVNTGSYISHANSATTILNTNLEAVAVIARQVRLRNLGGIIIIDFIDMESLDDKAKILDALKTALAKDSVRTEISELSSLGLLQMTRKRTRESLEHVLCVPCPQCLRRGSVKSLSTLACEIYRQIKKNDQIFDWPGFLVLASSTLVDSLLKDESRMVAELEAQLGKSIKLQVESTFMQEQFDILPLPEKD